MLGIPDSDHARFRDWIHRLIEESPLAGDATFDAIFEIGGYLAEHVADHRDTPRDDIITHLLDAHMPDGRTLDDREILGVCLLLLLAGIDTTWSAIGSSLLHLATHPDDRRRLVDEPGLIHSATEEFLRAFAPVTMAREVVEDTVVGGCPMQRGDRVLLPFPSGNRDPDAFDQPDQVILDRRDQPALRVRGRHPPLPGVQPRPHGAAGHHRRPGSIASPSSRSPTPTPSPGLPARCEAPAPCPSPSPNRRNSP